MIENDMLIRKTPVYDGRDMIAIRKDCIITKEEFLECFNEWVVKPKRKSVSIQTEFYIPADNGGVTPV